MMLFIIKTILLITGTVVWFVILSIIGLIVYFRVRAWDGWERASKWLKRANGERE